MNAGPRIQQEIINVDFIGNFAEYSSSNESATEGTGGTGGNVGGTCCSGQGGVGNSYGGTNGIGNHHNHQILLPQNMFSTQSNFITKTSSIKEIVKSYH